MKEKIRQLNFEDERPDFQQQLEYINLHRHPIALLLDGLQDSRNVGSIFRLADAANIEKIYLYNCNFDPNQKKIQRTARSTIQYVPFEIITSLSEIQALHHHYDMVGLDITNNSVSYLEYRPQNPLLLVIGSERMGISQDLLQETKSCIHLPMHGINTSMNVLCATGIAVYHFLPFFQASKT